MCEVGEMGDAVRLRLAEGVRIRREYFGVLAWRRDASEFVSARGEHANVLLAAELGLAVSEGGVEESVHELLAAGLVDAAPWSGPGADLVAIAGRLRAGAPPEGVARPLWAHLQPFTRCNQECVHCYCFGGASGDGFRLDESTWLLIIQRLANYGIRDIYITGGESLLYASVFRMAEYILELGLRCGLSTNAMAVTDRMAERLQALSLSSVQVSLDGGTAATNDLLRGVQGAFDKTLRGLDRLAAITSPVINTVATSENLDELEAIVGLGVERGCGSFKFFPEKVAGRGRGRQALDPIQLDHLAAMCAFLRDRYEVEIESLDNSPDCGSADTGFAVDQAGDVYPCIFGIADPGQRAGNILDESLDAMWFDSPVFRRFRAASARPCQRCQCNPEQEAAR